MLGLALIPELVRVEDALARELEQLDESEEQGEGHEVQIRFGTDAEIRISCPSCGRKQVLSECEMKREGDDTVYWCRNGCQKLIVIGPQADGPLLFNWESPWGEYVIRNVAEMHVPVYNKDTGEHVLMFRARALRYALVQRGLARLVSRQVREDEFILGVSEPVVQDSED